MVTVFFLGATGYLGGAILVDLVKHFTDLEITALVRKKENLKAVSEVGAAVEVVQGTFDDTDLIAKHARTADITVNAADSDNIGLTTAILAGQKARVVEDKKKPAVLFHTSGVAVFAGKEQDGRHDDSRLKIWNDGNEEDIRAINSEMLHGQVDVLILRASEEGYTESYIMCPGAIFGRTTGPVLTSSVFFKFITPIALKQKKSVYVGEGSNVFYGVLLDDLIDLYRRVFARILSREDAKASPYARYYIATSTPLVWKDIATLLGEALKKMGKIEDPVPKSISVAGHGLSNMEKVYLGASQRVKGERAKALGWEPGPVVLEKWMDGGVEVALANEAL